MPKKTLEKCASECSESSVCNTFDFCFQKSDKGEIESMTCSQSTKVFSKDIITEKEFECSTYSRIKTVKASKTVNKYVPNGPIAGWVVGFLSFLFLVIGVAGGAVACYFIIKRFFVSY